MKTLSGILDAPVIYLTYQWLVGGIQARRRCVQDHVHTKPGMRVLDIGCGPGYVAGWLEGVSYVGLDTDPGYIEYASKKYANRGKFSCELMTDAFIESNEPFDYVLMTGVLHHLDDATFSEVMRLSHKALKPGGVLVTLDGYYAEGLNPVAKFFLDQDRGKFIRRVDEYIRLAGRTFGNIRQFDHPEYFHIPYTTLVMECQRQN